MATTASAAPLYTAARKKLLSSDLAHTLQGRACVLTKGTFDILHSGHFALLSFCASQARASDADGQVVVVVESDESVRKRKGPLRPFQDEAQRAIQMALQQGVDVVLVAAKEDLSTLLSQVRPTVYVKGMDTAADAPIGDVDGGQVELPKASNPELTVIDWDCRVVVFTDDGAISTSSLVKTIAAKGGDVK